jgi:hypothetical protein
MPTEAGREFVLRRLAAARDRDAMADYWRDCVGSDYQSDPEVKARAQMIAETKKTKGART